MTIRSTQGGSTVHDPLVIPDVFNAAAWFVDRNIEEGRADRIAIECGDQRVTYQELLRRVNRVGSALRMECGVRREERVAVLLTDTPEFVYSFFGAMKIGAVPVPINTLWKSPDYEYVLNDSRARVLIVDHVLLRHLQEIPPGRLRYLCEVVVVGSDDDAHGRSFVNLLAGGADLLDAAPTSKDEPAFWLYSSGSTGLPKGCVHLHHDMVVSTELYAKNVLRMSDQDRCFSVAKLFFAYGLGNAMYFPFAVGGTTILWPGSPTAANVYDVIENHHPTLLFSVPTNYAMLLAHTREGRDFDLASVRYGVSAGEALPPALFERFKQRFGVEILDGIGSTEVLHIFVSNHPGAIRPGSSGQLVNGYEAKLVDDDNVEVAADTIGNLLIAGDSTCAYYWNQHEKTKETIEGRWIRTGDKYIRDADGYYWYAGRSDDMLKVGGIWVSPVEVENVLVEHPAVLECGVCGCEDKDGLIKPYAHVVLRDSAMDTDDLSTELQQFVRTRLAEYKRPRWVEFIPALPKTATGKIQRYKLRERVGQHQVV